jgi:hypothetical protein
MRRARQPLALASAAAAAFLGAAAAFAVAAAGGCKAQASAPATAAEPSGSTLVVAPGGSAPAPVASASASASAPAPASAVASAEPPEPAAAEVDAAPPEAPLPNVKVANIGMHIGGGPNDAATKEPIGKSVEPHFDEFRRCFARVFDPKKGGDFGVDLLVPADGGIAKVSHPRTSLRGERFEECVMDVFAKVAFQKPRFGLTTVSYSLRFTPGA